jgi:hypothetical protein
MLDLLALAAEEAAAAAAAEAAAAAAAEGAATAAVTDITASAMPDMSGISSSPTPAMMEGMPKMGLMELIAPTPVNATLPPMESAMPDMSGMSTPQVAPPMSFGQQMGNVATNAVNEQIAPVKGLFNTVIDPKSTAGDIGRSAFEYSIKQKEEPSMAPQMSPYSNPYANMANNTVGGIPSLLQNTQSGLLPFFGTR